MGTIRVGKNNPVAYKSSGWTTVTEKAAQKVLSEEEKALFIASVEQMPKDKWVSALRNAGLEAEANECERQLAEEHLQELRKASRATRLAEIKAMKEEEQLPLLIEEGFEDEAKELSEKLSAEMQDHEDSGNGEENHPIDVVANDEPVEQSEEVKPTKAAPAPKESSRKSK